MLAQLATPIGINSPTLEPSRYNPFNEGVNSNDPIFSTYVKWDGRTDLDHHGLKIDRTYRVVSAEIEAAHTDVVLQDIITGAILTEKYNSVLFKPLPTYIGFSNNLPKIGKRYDMIKIEAGKAIKWNTSTVIGLESLGLNTWSVITKNSLYVVQVM